MYITASSTISFQPTFRNKGFSLNLSDLKLEHELIAPDYNPFIPAMERRRMSPVLKMAITCSIDCLEQTALSQPDAIIVGTSMGCCVHSKKFLDKIVSANDGPISPTSFILSTHNTIAGQISILLKNHGYNMTHTQNSLSFEQALIDGMLCISDGFINVLVGGADENEDTLYNMKERLVDENILTSCGVSFFILSNEKSNPADIKLIDVGSFGLVNEPYSIITEFMASNKVSPEEIDLILYSNSDLLITDDLKKIFGLNKMINFQKISGTYLTNSSFAMNYGIDILTYKNHPLFGERINKVLVCNNLIPENLGLILLQNNNE